MSRPVYKHSLEHKFICKYQSTTQAARDLGVDESTIRKAADKTAKAANFIWTRYRLDVDEVKAMKSIGPKILILDIETAPCLAYVWHMRMWKTNVSFDSIVSNWFMLTYSYKWLGEDKIYSNRLTSKEVTEENDYTLVDDLWHILSEADIVVAHNGSKFDIPNLNSRFILHGFPPPSAFKQIDTLQVAQRKFGFSHNNLDALAQMFGIGEKLHTNFELWKRCMRGEENALIEMEIYNQHDVRILEQVYYRMRPYIGAHPNFNLYIDDKEEIVCPCCGSSNLKENGYYYFTQTAKYKNYRCLDCGSLARERSTVLQKSKSKKLLISNG